MQTHRDFNKPLQDPQAQLESEQPQGRRWSIATLMAARPNPKHDTRAKAVAWNERYKHVPQVQVNPASFNESVQERSPEEIAENEQWLKDLGNGIERPNPRFSK